MSDTWNHEADAWDDLVFNEERYHDDPNYGSPTLHTCKMCGTACLDFVKTQHAWHLREHNCFTKLMQKMRNLNVSST